MNGTRQTGQAAVETIGVAMGLALLVLVGWQAIVAAHTWQTAQSAARVAARAGSVRAPAERAARAVLPDRLAKRASIVLSTDRGGHSHVRVRLAIPSVLPWLGSLGTVQADQEVRP